MKTVLMVSTVDQSKCTGCGFCTTRCIYDAIRIGADKKASVDEGKCLNCMGCFEVCPQDAVSVKMLDEPRIVSINIEEADQEAVEELCRKVGRDPERIICPCTHSTARELAAAIVLGAHTVGEIALMTGITGSCRIHCVQVVLSMLEAAGYPQKPTDNNHIEFHSCEPSLLNIPEEVMDKYPMFHLREDKEEMLKNEVPFLAEMF